jgi:arylsulfatase A-like enzyme
MNSSPARATVRLLVAAACVAGLASCRRFEPRFDTVVLVTLDTLRADHLGCYGYPRPTTPFLDSLAASGLRFSHAYSSVSHTAPAHASMLTGLHPPQHQVLANGMDLDRSIPSLASLLRSAGFETAAFVSVRFLGGIGRDFDHFDAEVDRDRPYRHRPGDETVGAVSRWLAQRESGRPLLLWVHLFDPHERVDEAIAPDRMLVMEQDLERQRDGLIDLLVRTHGWSSAPDPNRLDGINRYDAQIRAADTAVAELHRAIEDRAPPGHRTLWVVTADHGEELGDHGRFGHGRTVHREQMHVPLIVASSAGWWQPRVVDSIVRHVDLLPTIADLVGLEIDVGRLRLEGTSLAAVFDGRTVAPPIEHAFYQRRPVDDEDRQRRGWEPGLVAAIQTPSSKYIFHSDGEHEFYDLAADPYELDNRIQVDSPEKERMYRMFVREMRRLTGDHRIDPQGRNIDEGYHDDLKALGYL